MISKPLEPTFEPVHLKVMVLPYLSYAPFYIAQEEGYFTEQGLEVEFVRMDDTSQSIVALIKGDLDVSSGTMEISVLNSILEGTNIKYVADKGYMDPDGCDYLAWVARKDLIDSGILDDTKNIAGKKIDFDKTSTDAYFLEMMLKDTGLTSEDVEDIELSPPNRLESLINGGIGIGIFGEPWTTRAVNGGGVIWKSPRIETPNFPYSMVFFGPNLLDKNPDAGEHFMVAYLKGVQQYNLGKTNRNIEIIARETQLSPEEIKEICWQSIKPDGSVDLQQIMNFQAWAVSKGYLDRELSEEQLWDARFIDYAQKAISP